MFLYLQHFKTFIVLQIVIILLILFSELETYQLLTKAVFKLDFNVCFKYKTLKHTEFSNLLRNSYLLAEINKPT